MPLFFILSGFLWNDRRKWISCKKLLGWNARRYLIPYAVLCGINLILEYGISTISHDEFNLGKYIHYPQLKDLKNNARKKQIRFVQNTT